MPKWISSSKSNIKRIGFTLIEMLVVIGIIAILMAILLPVLNNVRNYARRARARTEVRQLSMAWNAYLSDYRTWFPAPGGGITLAGTTTEMNLARVQILAGIDTANNRRGIMYYEFPNTNTNYLDPWRATYKVYLDVDYDNSVDTGPAPGHGIVSRNVAVWSKGIKNGLDGTTDNNSDDIMSWE